MKKYVRMKKYEIKYKKRNGEIITRYIDWLPEFGIGERNRYNWLILDIKHLWNGKYYSFQEFADKLYEYRVNQKKLHIRMKRKIIFFINDIKRNVKIKIKNW